MNGRSNWNAVLAVFVVVAAAGTACALLSDPAPGSQASSSTASSAATDARAAERFRAAGKDLQLTVVPARLAGDASPQVGEVLAMMLERAGMTNLETSDVVFTPPEDADITATAQAFADFVHDNPPDTEYALFANFQGSPRNGASAVRGVVVSRQGEVVWQDEQVKGDADFDRIKPNEPMLCCVLVVQRLRPVLGLNPVNKNAPPGKITTRWQRSTGLPDQAETAAIKERGAAFRKAAANATLIVYPARAGDAFSAESAADIAARINKAKLTNATAAETGPRLDTAGNMNEQKALWDMAHAFSGHVRQNPPDADYVLFADYLMGKDAVGGVHFAICDRQGELVVVDFQNSHWPDFKSINPQTREDCDKLVVKRLKGYCK